MPDLISFRLRRSTIISFSPWAVLQTGKITSGPLAYRILPGFRLSTPRTMFKPMDAFLRARPIGAEILFFQILHLIPGPTSWYGICTTHVGLDDIPVSAFIHPSLTTVAMPTQVMGRRAVEVLLSKILEDDIGRSPRRLVLPTTVIVRKSTAPPTRRPTWN